MNKALRGYLFYVMLFTNVCLAISMPVDSIRLLLNCADSEYDAYRYGVAYDYYRLVLLKEKHAFDTSPVFLRMGEVCYFTGRYDEGIYFLYELLEKYELDNKTKVKTSILLGKFYMRLQQDSVALRHLSEAQHYILAENKTISDSLKRELLYDLYICHSSIALQPEFKQTMQQCRIHC